MKSAPGRVIWGQDQGTQGVESGYHLKELNQSNMNTDIHRKKNGPSTISSKHLILNYTYYKILLVL